MSRVADALRVLGLCAFYLSISCEAAVLLALAYPDQYWSPGGRTALVLVGCFPAIAWAFFFGLYAATDRTLRLWQYAGGIFVGVVLTAPAALFVFRNAFVWGTGNPVIATAWGALVVLLAGAAHTLAQDMGRLEAPPPLTTETFFSKATWGVRVLGALQHVMSIYWRDNHRRWERDRESPLTYQFSDGALQKRDLSRFQDSLSCPLTESLAAADLVADELPAGVSLLDVGGGDGAFSSRFVEALAARQRTIEHITMLDPLDWGLEYRAALSGRVAASRIRTFHKRLEDASVDRTYDLVMAVHSLYFPYDVLSTPGTGAGLVGQLTRFLAPRGVLLVVLASDVSPAYEFKRRAYEALGMPPKWLSAEKLVGILDESPGLERTEKSVRNWIDLSGALDAYESGQPAQLLSWMAYFLRVKPSSLMAAEKRLVALLNEQVVEWSALDAGTRGALAALGWRESISRVVQHDSKCFKLLPPPKRARTP